ncbi:hypothetical protein MHB77_30440 [Paenibacillus sp. FSL K6-3166]
MDIALEYAAEMDKLDRIGKGNRVTYRNGMRIVKFGNEIMIE